MEIKEFIQHFAEQFDDTDASVFTPETKFRELDEWSSILALGIIAMIDEEYEVTLKAADMQQAITVGDLFELVKSKIA